MTFNRKMLAGGLTSEKVYAGLTPANLRIFDFKRLVTNSTNRFGVVNGSNVITQINSASPGVSTYTFPLTGTGPSLTGNGAFFTTDTVAGKFIEASASNAFDFTYVGTSSTVKFTIIFAADVADHGGWSAILGNSDFNNTLGGLTIYTDTGSSLTEIHVSIHNTSGVNVCQAQQNGILTIGTVCIYCIEVDLSLAAASRVKMWRGNTAFTPSSSGSNSPMGSPVSRKWAICSGGDLSAGNVDFSGSMAHLAVYNGIMPNRQQVMNRLSQYLRVPL